MTNQRTLPSRKSGRFEAKTETAAAVAPAVLADPAAAVETAQQSADAAIAAALDAVETQADTVVDMTETASEAAAEMAAEAVAETVTESAEAVTDAALDAAPALVAQAVPEPAALPVEAAFDERPQTTFAAPQPDLEAPEAMALLERSAEAAENGFAEETPPAVAVLQSVSREWASWAHARTLRGIRGFSDLLDCRTPMAVAEVQSRLAREEVEALIAVGERAARIVRAQAAV